MGREEQRIAMHCGYERNRSIGAREEVLGVHLKLGALKQHRSTDSVNVGSNLNGTGHTRNCVRRWGNKV
jgi:hypothetical protein